MNKEQTLGFAKVNFDSSLLAPLLGEKYQGYFSIQPDHAPTLSEWKDISNKILKRIELAIQHIQSDQAHITELLDLCSKCLDTVKRSKSVQEIDLHLINFLTRIMFTLFGNMPDYHTCSETHHKSHWNLSNFRTIHYSQTNDQKSNLILHYFKTNENLVGKYPELRRIHNDHKNAFIPWFKKEYPEIYCEIF